MLELMRKHARNWLMKVILGIIIFVFILYFGSMGGKQKAESIAIIDGKPLANVDFQREYQNLVDSYRQRGGDTMTEDLLKKLNLKQQALDNLINQAIILYQADKLKLRATPEEARLAILSFPSFQRNGVFNDRLYRQILSSNKMTPEEFEEIQIKALTAAKVENLISDAAHTSEQEVYDLYKFQNEKFNIHYLQFFPKDFKAKVIPSQKDLETYFNVHSSEFRKPEEVQVKYISFFTDDFAPSVKITDIDAADYYENNKGEFLKNGNPAPLGEVKDKIVAELKRVKGKLIAEEEAKKAHDTIYQEENFDAYATQRKLKINTTGFFPFNKPPSEFIHLRDFSKIAFDLKGNEISDILSDDRGCYILKLVTRKPSYTPRLTEVKQEVESAYIEAESVRLCREESESVLNRLRKGEDIQNIAQQNRIKVGETGLFLPGSNISGLGSSQELSEALFQISENKPYPKKALTINGTFVVIQFKERGKLDNDDFEAKKENLRNILLEIKKKEFLQAWLESCKALMLKEGKLKYKREIKNL